MIDNFPFASSTASFRTANTMCGLGLSLCLGKCCQFSSASCVRQELDERTLNLLCRRGPDHFETISFEMPVDAGRIVSVNLWAAVLSLRGDSICPQPARGSNGLLCFNGEIYNGLNIAPGMSDTAALLESLSSTSSPSAVAALISSLRGPWAFVYICQKSKKIYIGRDIFGRKCLLIRETPCGFQLTSVAYNHDSENENKWEEIPAQGVYVYDLLESSWALIRWNRAPSGSTDHNFAPCKALQHVALAKQRLTCPITAALRRELPKHSSERDGVMDYGTLLEIYADKVMAFEEVLTKAVIRRVDNIPQRYAGIPIGILFSGGIDSTLIAAIAMKYSPDLTFDLINVAFEHEDSQRHLSFDTPDRCTSIEAFKELESLPCIDTSKARLICVDVPYDELQCSRAKSHVPRLVHPMTTVLDDSLGFALWFAARGRGREYRTAQPYESKARVLLLGMGADEQLGGYSRHAASFKGSSWSSLGDCVALDIDRISWRNLGRDDRIVADLGRESRTPFLDEDLVSFLNDLPLDLKMRLDLPRGVGDKLILRLLAYKMCLRETARRTKRALQFGSRIAHADPKKSKGHYVCNRLE